MPADVPVRFEAGTPNTVGLAGWLAALSWLLAQDRTALRAAEIALTRRLQDRLEGAAGITLHGPADPASRTGIAALTLRGWDPSTAEMVLASAHGILVRAGHHCAPLAAEALSLPAGGSIRLSLGWTTGEEDIDAAGAAVCALSDNPPAG